MAKTPSEKHAARSAERAKDVGRDMARLGGRKVDTVLDDRSRGASSPLGARTTAMEEARTRKRKG